MSYQVDFIFPILFWCLIFGLVSRIPNIPGNKETIWRVRVYIVGFIHGTLCISYSFSDAMWEIPKGLPNTEYHNFVLKFSLVYWILDFLCGQFLKIHDKSTVFHHFITAFATWACVFIGLGGVDIMHAYFWAQLANPLKNLKLIMLLLCQKNTKTFVLVEVFYIFLCFFSRTMWLVLLLKMNEANFILRILAGFMLIPFGIWNFNLGFTLKKRVHEYYLRKEAKIELPWFEKIIKLD